MKTPQLLLHPEVSRRIDAISAKPYGAHIWAGPGGVGKKSAAVRLLIKLNCVDGGCQDCAVCRTIIHGNSPDFVVVEPTDKKSIGIGQIQALAQQLHLKAAKKSTRRLVFIEDAHTMTTEAQNALLKTLEEPPPGILIILSTPTYTDLLPTIRSRCQLLNFSLPGNEVLVNYLSEYHGCSKEHATAAVKKTGGIPGAAVLMLSKSSEEKYADISQQLAIALNGPLLARLKLAAEVVDTPEFLPALEGAIRAEMRQAESPVVALEWSRRLAGIEKYYRHRSAHVQAKTALEALVVSF